MNVLLREDGAPMFTTGAARSGRRTPGPHARPAAPLSFTRGGGRGGAVMLDDTGGLPARRDVVVMALRPGTEIGGIKRREGWVGVVPGDLLDADPGLLRLGEVDTWPGEVGNDGTVTTPPPPPDANQAIWNYFGDLFRTDPVLKPLRAASFLVERFWRLPSEFYPIAFSRQVLAYWTSVLGESKPHSVTLQAMECGYLESLWRPLSARGNVVIDPPEGFLESLQADLKLPDGDAAEFRARVAATDKDARSKLLALLRQQALRRDAIVVDLCQRLRDGTWHAVAAVSHDVDAIARPIPAAWWREGRMMLDWKRGELRPTGDHAAKLPFFRSVEIVPAPVEAATAGLPSIPSVPLAAPNAIERAPATPLPAIISRKKRSGPDDRKPDAVRRIGQALVLVHECPANHEFYKLDGGKSWWGGIAMLRKVAEGAGIVVCPKNAPDNEPFSINSSMLKERAVRFFDFEKLLGKMGGDAPGLVVHAFMNVARVAQRDEQSGVITNRGELEREASEFLKRAMLSATLPGQGWRPRDLGKTQAKIAPALALIPELSFVLAPDGFPYMKRVDMSPTDQLLVPVAKDASAWRAGNRVNWIGRD